MSRALVTTRLRKGTPVVVCGSHDIMHRRMLERAETEGELRTMLRERRDTTRRRPIPDELGARLIDAFSTRAERRVGDRRRA